MKKQLLTIAMIAAITSNACATAGANSSSRAIESFRKNFTTETYSLTVGNVTKKLRALCIADENCMDIEGICDNGDYYTKDGDCINRVACNNDTDCGAYGYCGDDQDGQSICLPH